MDSKIISSIAAILAELDFSNENEKIAACERRMQECEAAIARAEARRTEIADALRFNTRPDGRAVGDALLADVSMVEVALAGPSREAMEQERESLTEGIRDLRWRIEDARHEISCIKGEAMGVASQAVGPLVEHLTEEARRAVSDLPALYAGLQALNFAAKAGTAELDSLREILVATMGAYKLLPRQNKADIPEAIADAVLPLRDKGSALADARFVTSVVLP
ncbi:hypothetical protein [Novosphingobium colocasiae]|uniref:hypothetical protein n=1 Tax=Novosphingobium colocasiae TaxID=1256513 RepID=UPI0035AE8915